LTDFVCNFSDIAQASANLSLYTSNPNPRVGASIADAHGQLIGLGHTQRRGHAHAEIMALRDAATRGLSVKGATAYLTLEPCSHYGRTPPCCNALIESGLAKVVVAILDPNPLVAGRGVQMLRAAGVEVEVLPQDSVHAVASRELNIGFFSRMLRKTPWVRLKVAASLDGQTALSHGDSQWITGDAARADGHTWRARSCAVLTGIGTVLHDDPLLDVRHIDTTRQPHLVIVDSKLQIPLNAKLWGTLAPRSISINAFNLSAEISASIPSRAIWIYTASQDAEKIKALEALGAEVTCMPEKNGVKVDLQAMLMDLARREINELHVEAGFKLNGALIDAGLVDELLLYTAPKLLGPGMGIANIAPLAQLDQAIQLEFRSADMVGADLRILARLQGRDQF
jgi:diaminohydroxyphosphoribosylaminopyrimidine deaminase / 5-amino-6-(5-phosphoribosylamino)uracil reductase